jgi:hypothetical protein
MEKIRDEYGILEEISEEKAALTNPRRRWKDNIKMHYTEIDCDNIDGIRVAQDKDQWRYLVKQQRTLGFHKRRKIYYLAKRLHGVFMYRLLFMSMSMG